MRKRQHILESDVSVPLIAQAWVTDYDSQFHRLKVMLADGQPVPYSVQVLINGPADPFAINQTELPRRGSKGIVLFPNRDIRSGVWLGSYNANLNNAVTSGPQTPFDNFFAHWNGAFELLDQAGNYTKYLPDGTFFQITASIGLPVLHHNVYNGSNAGTGQGTRQTFPASARIPNPPSPFNVYLSHPTGTAALITPAGAISVTGVSTVAVSSTGAMTYQTASTLGITAAQAISVSGGATLGVTSVGNMTLNTAGTLSASAVGNASIVTSGTLVASSAGNMSVLSTGSITASAAAGQTISVIANGTTFQIDASGNILITLAGGKTMQVNSAADALVLASALVTLYNAHTHPVTATGGAQTGVPHVAATTGGLGSTLVKVAS